MKHVLQAFDQVEAASGRNAKMAILRDLVAKHGDDVKDLVRYTVNPMWMYRTGAPSASPGFSDLTSDLSENSWRCFRQTLDLLRTKQVEMSTAKSSLTLIFQTLDSLHSKWFTRVINRDLKMGFQDWNKFFPGMIPQEPVMLCCKWDGEKLVGEWVAEPKLDGLRAAVVIDENGCCTAISRGNKEFWNWEHIERDIQRLGLRSVVLDGEFFAGNFGQSSSIVKSQRPHPDADKLQYIIFDMLTLKEWDSLKCDRSLEERRAVLEDLKPQMEEFCPHLILNLQVPVQDNAAEVASYFYNLGYEGVVLKKLSSKYIWDRSLDWLKIKPEEDADLTIVNAYPGQKGTKYETCLGALEVEGTVVYKKKEYQIRCRVGGGLKDSDREQLWQEFMAGRLVGKTVEVHYQDVTTEISMGRTQPSLRFPKFFRMRPDKDRA